MAIARQIAEAYFAAALDRGNLEDALRQLRHDVEFASPAAQIRGRDELRRYLEGFAGAFPDARYTISRAIESGSSVALEGVYSATHTGTLRMPDGTELAATGRGFHRACRRSRPAGGAARSVRADDVRRDRGGGACRPRKKP